MILKKITENRIIRPLHTMTKLKSSSKIIIYTTCSKYFLLEYLKVLVFLQVFCLNITFKENSQQESLIEYTGRD